MLDYEYTPNNGKIAVYVVRVDNYFPELCEVTLPNIKMYAEKIGGELIEITERKYPDFPPTYEKVQVYELGYKNEWNILIDADFLIHPLTPNFTKILNPNVVGINYGYDANAYLDTRSIYFQRDGRNRGIATGLVMTNNLTHDLWEPLPYDWKTARKYTKREFIIDEYCLSRNLARYGLKYQGILQEFPDIRDNCLIHLGVEEKTDEQKRDVINRAKSLIDSWR